MPKSRYLNRACAEPYYGRWCSILSSFIRYGAGNFYEALLFTSLAVVPTAMPARGYGRDNPYLTAVVQLDEGPSVTALLEGVDAKEPEGVIVEIQAVANFKDKGEGENRRVTPVFKPG